MTVVDVWSEDSGNGGAMGPIPSSTLGYLPTDIQHAATEVRSSP